MKSVTTSALGLLFMFGFYFTEVNRIDAKDLNLRTALPANFIAHVTIPNTQVNFSDYMNSPKMKILKEKERDLLNDNHHVHITEGLERAINMYQNNHFKGIKTSEQKFARDFSYMQVMGMTAMTALYAMPAEKTNWDKERIKNADPIKMYIENVSKGPVVDEDEDYINYALHPYWGAAYYTWGKTIGLDHLESVELSIFMSTFFWEYGWEALGETPSIQDLIVTPLVGSIMGVYMDAWSQELIKRDNKLWGSKILGTIAQFVLNPLGTMSVSAERLIEKSLKHGVEVTINYGANYSKDNQDLFANFQHGSGDPAQMKQSSQHTPLLFLEVRW